MWIFYLGLHTYLLVIGTHFKTGFIAESNLTSANETPGWMRAQHQCKHMLIYAGKLYSAQWTSCKHTKFPKSLRSLAFWLRVNINQHDDKSRSVNKRFHDRYVLNFCRLSRLKTAFLTLCTTRFTYPWQNHRTVAWLRLKGLWCELQPCVSSCIQ